MKIDGPIPREFGDVDYIDVDTYIAVGSKEWCLTTTMDVGRDRTYDGCPTVRDLPDGDQDDCVEPLPGVVVRAYASMRQKVLTAIEEAFPVVPASIKHGVITVECGDTVDLLAIQRRLVKCGRLVEAQELTVLTGVSNDSLT